MPLVIMSFFGKGTDTPLGDTGLKRAFEAGKALAPAGCTVEARAFDRTFIDSYYAPGKPPSIALDDPARLPPPLSAGAVSIWMDDSIDNLELATQDLSKKLHEALGAIGTVTFDARRHLDLVGSGVAPALQTVAVVERRPDLDRDTFMQYYRTHHVPLAKRLKPRFTRYTTFRTLEKIGDFPGDCVTIQEYPSLEELRQHMMTRTSQGDSAGDDVGNFISHLTYNIGERFLY